MGLFSKPYAYAVNDKYPMVWHSIGYGCRVSGISFVKADLQSLANYIRNGSSACEKCWPNKEWERDYDRVYG